MRPLEIGQRSETVRRSNLSAIVSVLHAAGPLSRSDLVARTGLTRSAIRQHVRELVAAQLVSEQPPAPVGLPGRPSPVVTLNAQRASVLALEITVDSLAAAHVGPSGEVIRMRRVERRRGTVGVDEIVAQLAALAHEVRSEPLDATSVGVGVAVAGVVRRADGLIRTAPNLGWRDIDLRGRLATALATTARVSVANEGDLGGLAEARRGAAVGVDDVVYISGEVGVGGGITVGGQALLGAAGYGGEIGHIPVNAAGRRCRCGAMGCWETEIGEDTLLRLAGDDDGRGDAAVDRVLAAAQAGEPRSLAAVDHVGRWLGIGLAGLVNIFNPRLIVLGGRFARLAPVVIPLVEGELDRRALAASRRLVAVVPAALGDDAPLLGAAELAFEPLLADPAAWLDPRSGVEPHADSVTTREWRAVA